VDYYDSEYRRQYCRERAERAREEYRRVQAAPKDSHQPERVSVVWSMWKRVRRRTAQSVPVYRS